MTLRRRAVVEVDHVGPVAAGAGTGAHGANAEPDIHAVTAQELGDRLGVAGMLGRHQAVAGLDDRDRDAEADVDLRQLAAGRPAAQDDEALRQLAGEGRLAVRPHPDAVEARQGWDLRGRADRDHDLPSVDLVDLGVVADLDMSAARDPGGAPIAGRAGLLQAVDMRRVVGLLGLSRPVDHEVAGLRGPLPRIRGRVRGVLVGTVEERLRREATDVRAAAAEPQPIDDRDAGAARSGLVGGGLTGRTGADDDEVEVFHGRQSRRSAVTLR